MNVGGVEPPPVVYLSPQAISPLSASKEPIALALATRPEPADPAANNPSKAAEKAVDKVQEVRQAPAVPESTSPRSPFAGGVDVYV